MLKVSGCRVYSQRAHSAQQIAALLIAGLSVAIASQPARATEPVKIPMTAGRWTTVAGTVNFVEHMGKPSIELQPGDYRKGIPSGITALKDFQFGNGTIEYDVSADSGMGAALMFRAASKENCEMFYLRPRPNCQEAPDCVQYAPQTRGALLWDIFPQYQGPAPLHSGQWNHVRLVISGKRMNIYFNGATQPTLKVSRLEGDTDQGGLMLAGPGFFADLTVKPDEVGGLPPDPEPDETASDDRFVRHWQVSAFSKLAEDQAPVYADLTDASAKWVPLEAERGGLINASRIYGLPLPRGQRTLVWLKTTIHSSSAQQKHASFGWVREAFVFVNGQLVYADKNLYQPPAARKAPDGRLSLENGSLMQTACEVSQAQETIGDRYKRTHGVCQMGVKQPVGPLDLRGTAVEHPWRTITPIPLP
jgi:hypothetical protein